MDQNSWSQHCISASFANLTLSTKCIKQSASFLLTMPEQADAMSKLWLAAFKSASEPAAQLALLYVVNEIILKCSSYGAPEVKTHFQEPLLEAIRYLRPGLLIKKVKKLVTMWADQKVYEPKLMHQLLRSILNLDQKTGALKENSAEQEDAVSIKDFVPEKFLEQLRKLKQVEEVSPSVTESDLTPACLKFPIDVVLGRVKSKEEGRSLSCQISTCSDRLASVLKGLEKKLAAQEEVFEILGKAELFYSIQQKEAAIVANAYRTYGQRVQSTMDALEGTNRPSEAVVNDSAKFNSTTILESNQPDTTSATAASPSAFDTAVDDDDDDDDYDDYNGVGDNSAMAVSRTGFIDTDGEDEEDETDERDEFSELKTEPKSVPFGLTNQRRRTRLKSADSEVNDDNNVRQPFDFVAVATFPFRELIRVDSNGDADYRPMFEKMRERQSQSAGNFKRSHEEMAYNAAFDLPGSGDFDGRRVEVKPSRPVDMPDRNGLTGSPPQPLVAEDNMDVSDDEAKEEPTLDDAPPPPPPPSEAVKVQSALTDTGDYDWRQAKPTLPKLEEPLPLGSRDADLRLLPHLGTHIPVKASPGPAKSIPERPEIVEPTGDSDLRVFTATRTGKATPTGSTMTEWTNKGDEDLRSLPPTSLPTPSPVPFSKPTAIPVGDTDIRSATAPVTATTTPAGFTPPNLAFPGLANFMANPTPALDANLLNAQLLTSAAAAAAAASSTLFPGLNPVHLLPQFPTPIPQLVQPPILSPLTPIGQVVRGGGGPAAPPVVLQPLAPTSATVTTAAASTTVTASSASSLLSSLRALNLPTQSVPPASAEPAASTASTSTNQPASDPLASLLRSLQRPLASTAPVSMSHSTVSTSPAVSATPTTATTTTSSQAEDPFTIISRLTGLSNLIQRPAATAPRPSEPAPVSPQYSDTSSEDETPPRAQTPQKQQTPPQPPLTSYEGLSLASRESGPPSNYDGINDRVKTAVGSMATQDTAWAAPALETAKAPTTTTTVGVFGGTGGLPDADSGDSSTNEEDGGATPTQDESADFSMRIPVSSTPSVPLAPTGFAFGSIARTLPLVTSQNVYSPGNFGSFLGGNTLPTGQPPASNFQLPMRMPPPPFGLMNLPSSTNAGGMPTTPWQQQPQQQQQPNPQGLPAQAAFLSSVNPLGPAFFPQPPSGIWA